MRFYRNKTRISSYLFIHTIIKGDFNMKEINNIKIYAEETYEDMSARAAEIFCQELKEKPNGIFGFATGSTPIGLYKELIKRYENGEIDFSGITSFNLDEYYPIKKSSDQSYDYFMKDNLFNHINIRPENINIPNGEASDAQQECLRYEEKINSSPGIDLQILGLGENGHIAFNEPSDSFTEMTNYIELTESTISANSRMFDSTDDVPKHALTMGIGTIMNAKKILLLINSERKAKAAKEALFGEVTPECPASILQKHPDVVVVVDKAVADVLDI